MTTTTTSSVDNSADTTKTNEQQSTRSIRKQKSAEPQTLGPNAEACCISWTGGKDCNLALLGCWRNPALNVTHLVVFKPSGGNGFRAHPVAVMRSQAKSLGLPLLEKILSPNLSYRDGYVDAIRELRDKQDIRVIATGDMDLVGEIEGSSDNYIKECCEMAGGGIRAYLPLWKADREECLRTLIAEDYKVVFSCVKSPWFDAAWCGRRIDRHALEEMMDISMNGLKFTPEEMSRWSPKDPRQNFLDLGGENGEYHTMVLNGPLYHNEIFIGGAPGKHTSIPLHVVVTGPAENGEDRWWTYYGQTRWSLGGNLEISTAPDDIDTSNTSDSA